VDPTALVQLDAIIATIHGRRRRHRWMLYGLAAVVLAMGAAGALGWIKSDSGPLWRYTLSALCVGGGIVIVRDVRKEPLDGAAERALRQRRDQIVWVYGVRGANTPSYVVLGLADGSMETAPVPQKRLSEIVSSLGAAMPQAAAGYDPDLEAQFKRDPASLRRTAA
jgi:hypothetical protein